ncbi:hypothetical protein D3C83_00350 [compost metagenome]
MELCLMVIVELERVDGSAVHQCRVGRAQRWRRLAPYRRLALDRGVRANPLQQRFRPRRRIAVYAATQRVEQKNADHFLRALRQVGVTKARNPAREFAGRRVDGAGIVHGTALLMGLWYLSAAVGANSTFCAMDRLSRDERRLASARSRGDEAAAKPSAFVRG